MQVYQRKQKQVRFCKSGKQENLPQNNELGRLDGENNVT
jgi:hypothetical protein